ncbi:MAG: hypothetical protein IH626_23005 [Rhodospirillales bacterium]|nr:hypothetical protein [Rhodospirillales bacterium]
MSMEKTGALSGPLAARIGRGTIRDRASVLKGRAGILANRIEARLFDLRHGTDTTGKVPTIELDHVVGENAVHGTGYQAVNEAHFRHVMASMAFPERSVFLDIGCGKGKALLLAATYSFVARAVGIEFGGALCVAARRNVITYAEGRKIAGKIEVLHQDALCYDFEPDQNILFMNNPFNAALFSVFVDRVHASIRKRPRPVWLLYANPAHSAVLDRHPGYRREALFRFFGPGRDIAVYGIG